MIFDGCGERLIYEKTCVCKFFDLLHNSLLTVSIYADRSELFAFGAS